MIILQKLRWSNCFSYGEDNELDLSKSTLTQILGQNGAGKSSIPLILEEVLYNKNSKGIKKADVKNRLSDSGYTIFLSFEKDEDKYEVEVVRKSNIKVILRKNDEDISSHTATNTYKTLQEILQLDFKTFSQLVYQSTNTSLQFLTATDTNRKKFLIDLLSLDSYVKLFETFKAAAKDASVETNRIEAQIETIEKWLSENNPTATILEDTLEVLNIPEDDLKEHAELTEEVKNIEEKNKKINKNNQYIEMLDAININEAQKIAVTGLLSYDEQQKSLGTHQFTVKQAKKHIEKLESLGDKCPTCEQSIDSQFKKSLIEAEQEKIDQSRQAYTQLAQEIEEIKTNNELFQKKQKIERDWQDLYGRIDRNLPKSILDKGLLEERLRRITADLRRRKEEILAIQKKNAEIEKRNTRAQLLKEQAEKFTEQLEQSQALLRDRSDLLESLEVLKKAFSINGLPAYKIENLVEELENLTNTYLGELSDGRFTIEFVVIKDKLNVEITDQGNVVDISALSSGELARVNTATLIAIRKLMNSISKSQINVLFLDEVISVLDDVGREKLVEVLLKEDLNTYIVSHFWQHPMLEKVEVIKSENISRLE